LDAATKSAWRDNIDILYNSLRDGLATNSVQRNGWSYPKPGIGNFGDNDVYRSAVAMEGLAALEPVEALYMFTRTTGDGHHLTGERSYRLRVPAAVPVDGFWSLSMYEESPEGRLYFVENPIGRYSVGNRTPGLKRNADGSIDILVQNAQPPAGEKLAARPGRSVQDELPGLPARSRSSRPGCSLFRVSRTWHCKPQQLKAAPTFPEVPPKVELRHLSTRGLTPAQYREKWGLPANLPMVAPAYAAKRSELARSMGLGRKAAPIGSAPVSATDTHPARRLGERSNAPKRAGPKPRSSTFQQRPSGHTAGSRDIALRGATSLRADGAWTCSPA
jgi:hypothetical protein